MNFDQEINELIKKHMQDIHSSVPDDIKQWPRAKRVWAWWKALAYYGHKGTWFVRLEDAPEGLKQITIMDETYIEYAWRNGKYVKMQEITEDECKALYKD